MELRLRKSLLSLTLSLTPRRMREQNTPLSRKFLHHSSTSLLPRLHRCLPQKPWCLASLSHVLLLPITSCRPLSDCRPSHNGWIHPGRPFAWRRENQKDLIREKHRTFTLLDASSLDAPLSSANKMLRPDPPSHPHGQPSEHSEPCRRGSSEYQVDGKH